MWPDTHQFAGASFTLYDLMRALAVAVAVLICATLNQRQRIPVWKTLLLAVLCVPLAIGAARVLNAIESGAALATLGEEVSGNPGSAIYGALFACLLVVAAASRAFGFSALRFLDAGGPAIAAGEAISRFGCFCAGCCHGPPFNGPLAVVFPAGSVVAVHQRLTGLVDSSTSSALPVLPVQIYGSLAMGAFTVWLLARFRAPHRPGDVLFQLLIGYGLYRLAMAPLRVEAATGTIPFSLLFVAAGTAGLSWNLRRAPAT